MRKYVSMFLAFILMIALAVPAAAAKAPQYVTYDLDEFPIVISVPDGFGYFTLGTNPSDKLFSKFDRDGKKMLDWMAENDIFMIAIAPDKKSEFRLTINTDDGFAEEEDFFDVDEDYLMNTAEGTAEAWEKRGDKVLECDYFMSEQLNYCYLLSELKDGGQCARFFTVVNQDGDAAMLSLDYVSQKDISDEELEMAFEVANNMNVLYYPVFYYDEPANILVAAPAGCFSVPGMTDENVSFTVRLPEGDYGLMCYSSQERPKEVGDLTDVSVEDFAKGNELSKKDVSDATYNGQRYLVVHSTQPSSMNGKDIKLDTYSYYTTYEDTLIMISYYELDSQKGANKEAMEEYMENMTYGVE